MKSPLLGVLLTYREIKFQVLCCLSSSGSCQGTLGFPRINDIKSGAGYSSSSGHIGWGWRRAFYSVACLG